MSFCLLFTFLNRNYLIALFTYSLFLSPNYRCCKWARIFAFLLTLFLMFRTMTGTWKPFNKYWGSFEWVNKWTLASNVGNDKNSNPSICFRLCAECFSLLSHLILTTPSWGGYCYVHFTVEINLEKFYDLIRFCSWLVVGPGFKFRHVCCQSSQALPLGYTASQWYHWPSALDCGLWWKHGKPLSGNPIWRVARGNLGALNNRY